MPPEKKERRGPLPSKDLDPGLATIGKQFGAVYEARIAGGEEEVALAISYGLTDATERNTGS